MRRTCSLGGRRPHERGVGGRLSAGGTERGQNRGAVHTFIEPGRGAETPLAGPLSAPKTPGAQHPRFALHPGSGPRAFLSPALGQRETCTLPGVDPCGHGSRGRGTAEGQLPAATAPGAWRGRLLEAPSKCQTKS